MNVGQEPKKEWIYRGIRIKPTIYEAKPVNWKFILPDGRIVISRTKYGVRSYIDKVLG